MRRPTQNLLLLTVDAWRSDFVDEHAGVPLTPTLHSLLPRAVRFNNAYANGPWTSPPLVSIFSGESPAVHGVFAEWSAPRPDGPALAKLLAAAGYQTPNICYLNRVGNYQNLGYEAESAPDYPQGPEDDLLLRAIREAREPWFLWYHYKYVHLPYWPAPAYRRHFDIDDGKVPARLRDSVCSRFVVPRHEFSLLPEDRALVRRLYASSVRQMDDFLLRVTETLSSRGLLPHTTLVLTADHGDELLEHGHVGHASTAHHATLHEEVLRVPLFLIDPRILAAKTVAQRVQGLDLFSTILALCGVTPPASEETTEAVDLSPLVLEGREPDGLSKDRAFYFHSARMGYLTPRSHEAHQIFGLAHAGRKYIYENYDAPKKQLFDLVTDPDEQAPLTDGPAVALAHDELLAYLQKAARRGA